MSPDEFAIHNLIARWTEASCQSDYAALEPLMHPDVLFLTAGNEPFGRDTFRDSFLALTDTMEFQASTQVLELAIADDLAYARTFVDVHIHPKGTTGEICDPPPGQPEAAVLDRKGHVLSIYRRNEQGEWQLYRDANLMTR
jgi:uncharacterized protein (TIGR02246 family)